MIRGVSGPILKLLILSICLNAFFALTIIVSSLSGNYGGREEQLDVTYGRPAARSMQARGSFSATIQEEEVVGEGHLRSTNAVDFYSKPDPTPALDSIETYQHAALTTQPANAPSAASTTLPSTLLPSTPASTL